MSKRKKSINFTIEVLDFFLGIPESFLDGLDRKKFYHHLNGQFSEKKFTYSNICKLFNNFKKVGYINVQTNGNQRSIKFTNKAKLAVVDRLVERFELDGQYRFISFDIPETMKVNRNRFRRTIKRMGFIQVQKSLWVCDKNVTDFIEIAAAEYSVSEYIVYIVSNQFDARKNVEEMFKKMK